MKNIIYAFLAVLMLLFLNSCQNNKKVENKNLDSLSTQREKSKLVIKYRKLTNVEYPETGYCIEKIASYKDPRAGIRFLFPKDISEFGLDTSYQQDSYYVQEIINFKKSIYEEDENYTIYVSSIDYTSSLIIFEDKKTKNRTFTVTGTIKGLFWINNSYWTVENSCHIGCFMSVARIQNPKLLKPTNEQNLDSLKNKFRRLSHQEKNKIWYQPAYDSLFSNGDLGTNLSAFIPYKNSMIIVFIEHKSNKHKFIQVNEDKSVEHIDSLINGKFEVGNLNEEYFIILPKRQNLIPFCNTVLKIENDTLFVYSLR